MKYCLVLLIAFFMLNLSNAKAEQKPNPLISGAYLLEICKRDDNGNEVISGGHSVCQAYIAGVVDYHNLLTSMDTSPNIDLCVPPTAKLNDLQDIVWQYLEQNAQHDAFIAAPAVSLALYEVFPCKKKR